jgi:hypothetical protein
MQSLLLFEIHPCRTRNNIAPRKIQQRIAVLAWLKRALTARDADDILNVGSNYFFRQRLEDRG